MQASLKLGEALGCLREADACLHSHALAQSLADRAQDLIKRAIAAIEAAVKEG